MTIRKHGTERIVSQSFEAITKLRKLSEKVTVPAYVSAALKPLIETLELNLETLNGALHGTQETLEKRITKTTLRNEAKAESEAAKKLRKGFTN